MRFLIFLAALTLWADKPTEDRAKSLLDASLHDKNPDVRRVAVQAIGLVGPHEPYLGELQSMLDDKDVEVRVALVTSLVDLKNPKTKAALEKALDDDVPEVSFAAAKALWSISDPKGRDALLSVLAGETKTSSGFITKQKRDAIRMLHTPRTMMMFAFKTGLGFAPVPGLGEGISSLEGILSDPSVSGRATSALLLSSDKSAAITDALIEALDDKDASVRAAAIHALALRNDPKLQEKIEPLFEDKKEGVRVRAAAAYLRLEFIKNTPKPPQKKAVPRSAPAKKQ
jgi:HEAT repeat protein